MPKNRRRTLIVVLTAALTLGAAAAATAAAAGSIEEGACPGGAQRLAAVDRVVGESADPHHRLCY